jgi:hypothetical protein
LLAAPLIGQLGKNFSDGTDGLIAGHDLIVHAEKKIKATQKVISRISI